MDFSDPVERFLKFLENEIAEYQRLDVDDFDPCITDVMLYPTQDDRDYLLDLLDPERIRLAKLKEQHVAELF